MSCEAVDPVRVARESTDEGLGEEAFDLGSIEGTGIFSRSLKGMLQRRQVSRLAINVVLELAGLVGCLAGNDLYLHDN